MKPVSSQHLTQEPVGVSIIVSFIQYSFLQPFPITEQVSVYDMTRRPNDCILQQASVNRRLGYEQFSTFASNLILTRFSVSTDLNFLLCLVYPERISRIIPQFFHWEKNYNLFCPTDLFRLTNSPPPVRLQPNQTGLVQRTIIIAPIPNWTNDLLAVYETVQINQLISKSLQ